MVIFSSWQRTVFGLYSGLGSLRAINLVFVSEGGIVWIYFTYLKSSHSAFHVGGSFIAEIKAFLIRLFVINLIVKTHVRAKLYHRTTKDSIVIWKNRS
jgi:hypothetical protein